MRKTTLIIGMALCTYLVQAQYTCPKSAKEDKENIMSEAYWKLWNPAVQEKIDRDIEKNRMGIAEVNLPGVPKGTSVTVEQTKNDFVFGAHIFNYDQLGTPEANKKYKQLYGDLFNSATVAFYWRTFETEPNRPRFAEEYWDTQEYWNKQTDPKNQPHWRRPSSDKVVDYCVSRGIRVQGHPLVWGSREWQIPTWIFTECMTPDEQIKVRKYISNLDSVKNVRVNGKYFTKTCEKYTDAYKNATAEQLSQEFPELAKTMKHLFAKRIQEMAEHYGNRVNSWDVVNESAHDYSSGKMMPGSAICKSAYGFMPGDYTYEGFQVAQKAFPDGVKLNINDYFMDPAYVAQVKDLRKRGCQIDLVGSQMHLFNPQSCLDVAAGKEIQTPDQVHKTMSMLGELGLPIHLSEITITAPNNDYKGQRIQAIITRNLYRLWFSIEPMMGITWWNVVDDCGAPGEPSVSGLFSRDMQPKPAYYAMNELINKEWKTNLTTKADKNGQIKFKGFKGEYRISWTDANGEKQIINYHLK